MSAIAEETTEGTSEVIQVLIALHPKFNALHFTGPLEVLSTALHNIGDPGKQSLSQHQSKKLPTRTNLSSSSPPPYYHFPSLSLANLPYHPAASKAFEVTVASATPATTSSSGLTLKADINYDTAHDDLKYYDILIVPGSSDADSLLKAEKEPIPLIKAFAKLQESDPSKERTLLGVCTGSLLLAQAGVLQGLAATTHPNDYTKMEIVCQEAARRGDLEQTDVMEERYVVNNARFELGEKVEENPYVLSKRPDGRRKSIARKGSNAWKESKRRESIIRRGEMRLGGLRVITSGGVTSGLDASLYLVAANVSVESANEVARILQYAWVKGVTVEGIDV